MTDTIIKHVSGKWFDENVTAKVACPGCGKTSDILVSISTTKTCRNCGRVYTVEFKIRKG